MKRYTAFVLINNNNENSNQVGCSCVHEHWFYLVTHCNIRTASHCATLRIQSMLSKNFIRTISFPVSAKEHENTALLSDPDLFFQCCISVIINSKGQCWFCFWRTICNITLLDMLDIYIFHHSIPLTYIYEWKRECITSRQRTLMTRLFHACCTCACHAHDHAAQVTL